MSKAIDYWNTTTAFLKWSMQAGADNQPYLHAQLDECEMDVCVCLDASGETWEVHLDGHVDYDHIESPASAQIIAIGAVITVLAMQCGDPKKEATSNPQRAAREFMEHLHNSLRDDGLFREG